MRFHKILFSNHGASIYVILIVASGVVLLLSMPSASRLSELIQQPWRPFPLPFFLTYAVLSAITALSIGSPAAPVLNETRKAPVILTVMARIAFGQFLMLPLVAYSRVLFPKTATPLIATAAYILLLGVLMALVGVLLEIYASHQARNSVGFRYGFLLAYMAIPLVGLASKSPVAQAIALVSPIQTIRRLLSGSPATFEWASIFLIPAAIAIGATLLILRKRQTRAHA